MGGGMHSYPGAKSPRGHQITARVPNGYRGRRKSQQCCKYFLSIQYICFRKTLCSTMGAPNFFLALGTIKPRCALDEAFN